MDRVSAREWPDRYFEAWVSNDPDEVAALFTEDAVYAVSPFSEPGWGVTRSFVGGRAEARKTCNTPPS